MDNQLLLLNNYKIIIDETLYIIFAKKLSAITFKIGIN